MPQFTVMRISNTASVAYIEATNEDEAKAKAELMSNDEFAIASTESYDTIISE